MTKQKVFISYSGPKGKALGKVINDWLRHTIQVVEPIYTPAYIQPGQQIDRALFGALEAVDMALLIYTQENTDCARMIFEAGTVCKNSYQTCVIPILFELEPTDLPVPIQAFQYVLFDKKGMRQVLAAINVQLKKQAVDRERLQHVFDREWGPLQRQVKAALERGPTTANGTAALSATARQAERAEQLRQCDWQLEKLGHKKQGLKQACRRRMAEIDHLETSLQQIEQHNQHHGLGGYLTLWFGGGAAAFLVYSLARHGLQGISNVKSLWCGLVLMAAGYLQYHVQPLLQQRREKQRFSDEQALELKLQEYPLLKQELQQVLETIKVLEKRKQEILQ